MEYRKGVLKWLSEFSEKLHQRAKDTEMEVNGLFGQAGAVELDLKNTVNTLSNLSRDLLINHASTDHNGYNDSQCASYCLIASLYEEKTSLGNTQLDLGLILESKQASSVAEELDSLDLFGPDIFGNQQDSSEQIHRITMQVKAGYTFNLAIPLDMTDPVAYAASDFKAMLEAALLNQYKFHDEESLSVKDILRDKMISGQIQTDVVGTSGERQVVSQGTSEQLNRTIEEDKPVAEGNFCSLTHPQELYSALLGGSLFDNDEDVLCSGQKDSTDVSTYDGESNSWRTDVKGDELVERVHSSSIHGAFGNSDQCLMASVGKDTSMCSDEEEGGQRARWQVVNSDERQKPTAVKPEDDVSSSLLAVVGDEILSAN
ncbi:hypothetical protein MUK42_11031 [Musa troglodytarum]|uniref:Uncharacterized protein n=1 Tax=Musa troglodytarum TaxID=320322 RepID=A0A9E7GX76_9LILI|nr:hypothetical protein MUK42_11031 [Musa troglodytarum]